MSVPDRVDQVISKLKAMKAKAEQEASLGKAIPPVDVSPFAAELGIGFKVELAPAAWASTEPPADFHWLDAMLAREAYLSCVLRGMMAQVSRGRGGLSFRFNAIEATSTDGRPMPPTKCHLVAFEAECTGEAHEGVIRIRVAGDRTAVPPGAR